MAITIYGIPSCDSVKKARAFFKNRQVNCEFVDFKKGGVPDGKLTVWMAAVGWEHLLNRHGSTWRQLDEAVKLSVVDWNAGAVTVGFNEPQFLRSLP